MDKRQQPETRVIAGVEAVFERRTPLEVGMLRIGQLDRTSRSPGLCQPNICAKMDCSDKRPYQ